MATVEHEVRVLQPETVELDDASRLLLAAADHIRVNGWWQDTGVCGGRDNGSTCLVLSVDNAHGEFSVAVRDEAINRLKKSMGFTYTHEAYDWNDAPERTKEQVIEALERAAYGV